MEDCDMPLFCDYNASNVTDFPYSVRLSILTDESYEEGVESIYELVHTLGDITSIPARQITVVGEHIDETHTRVNATMFAAHEGIANAAAGELRWFARDAATASAELSIPCDTPPVVEVTTTLDRMVMDSMNAPHSTGEAEAVGGSLRHHRIATEVDEYGAVGHYADSSLNPLHSLQDGGSISPPPPPPPGNNTNPDDYFHRLQNLSGVGRHLIWVLPILGFAMMTCCCLWWCSTSHTMHDEEPETCAAMEDIVMEQERPGGLVLTVDQDHHDAAKRRLEAQRVQALRARMPASPAKEA